MTDALPYATPDYQQAKPATVGFLLGVLGLGLIFLAGCFLLGILIVQSQMQSLTSAAYVHAEWWIYVVVLYAFAFACAGGGAFVTTKAVKKLIAA